MRDSTHTANFRFWFGYCDPLHLQWNSKFINFLILNNENSTYETSHKSFTRNFVGLYRGTSHYEPRATQHGSYEQILFVLHNLRCQSLFCIVVWFRALSCRSHSLFNYSWISSICTSNSITFSLLVEYFTNTWTSQCLLFLPYYHFPLFMNEWWAGRHFTSLCSSRIGYFGRVIPK